MYTALNSLTSGAGSNLRLVYIQIQFGQHAPDALLELTVLGGVDDGVDEVVAQHQDHGEVVEPAREEHGEVVEPVGENRW